MISVLHTCSVFIAIHNRSTADRNNVNCINVRECTCKIICGLLLGNPCPYLVYSNNQVHQKVARVGGHATDFEFSCQIVESCIRLCIFPMLFDNCYMHLGGGKLNTHTHAHMHARTYTHNAHTHTHTRTHTHNYIYLFWFLSAIACHSCTTEQDHACD